MKPRHQRLIAVVAGVLLVVIAAALVLNAFQGNVVFFISPSEVAEKAPQKGEFRIGGMVEAGSVKRGADGLTVRFVVTDTAKSIPVVYKGILPDLFKEGKGVVTQGRLGADGVFQASQVLAKHDENYTPPEAAHAVSKAQAEKAAKSLVVPAK